MNSLPIILEIIEAQDFEMFDPKYLKNIQSMVDF